ncbi:UrcA family protein [Sphingomonas sp. HF-S4]|uniref:UrcA family protein n=1 Tax=Sphingomonas agrestis TaxID=3080540 RepID=A0ABU3Y6W8_9SPHN|nr:UrcA family protein [Sphingomonas sp. HF-S4]MDV3456923.1 UrcA family protein [Sphingomonas sp. HF-S4]
MLIILSALAALATPAPQAVGPQRPPSLQVRHADLDLSRPEGRATLDRRISRAVKKLCADEVTGRHIKSLTGLRCRSESLARTAPLRNRAVAAATLSARFATADRTGFSKPAGSR